MACAVFYDCGNFSLGLRRSVVWLVDTLTDKPQHPQRRRSGLPPLVVTPRARLASPGCASSSRLAYGLGSGSSTGLANHFCFCRGAQGQGLSACSSFVKPQEQIEWSGHLRYLQRVLITPTAAINRLRSASQPRTRHSSWRGTLKAQPVMQVPIACSKLASEPMAASHSRQEAARASNGA